MITHYDLFAGIGGFSLAVDQVYGKENIKHIFVENNPFCTAVLRKHWPRGEYHGDIRQFIQGLTGMPAVEYIERYGISTEQQVRRMREDVREGNVGGGNRLLFSDYPTGNVEDTAEAGMQNASEPSLQKEKSLLPRRSESKRQSTQPDRTSSKKGSVETPNNLRKLRRNRKLARDTSTSFRLPKTIGSDVAMPTLPPRVAQEEQVKDIKYARPFILTGGFPCPSFSQAGKRKGTADARWLWPEMLAVIKVTKPRWVIAENVYGLITWNEGVAFETVCSGLETQGYSVQSFVIPACAVGAPHRRERVWIVAKNTKHNGGGIGEHEKLLGIGNKWYTRAGDEVGVHRETNASDTQNARLERRSRDRPQKTNTRFGQSSRDTEWNQNWFEVATRLCRMDDGLSEKLVRLPDGTKISYSRWRKEALKAYGNAIVPAVAMKILEAIRLSQETLI